MRNSPDRRKNTPPRRTSDKLTAKARARAAVPEHAAPPEPPARTERRDTFARVLQDHFTGIRSDRSMWDAAEAVLRVAEGMPAASTGLPPNTRERLEGRVEFTLSNMLAGTFTGTEVERMARGVVSVINEALGGTYTPPPSELRLAPPLVTAYTNKDRHEGKPPRFETDDQNIRYDFRIGISRMPVSVRLEPGWLVVDALDQQLIVEPVAANTIRIKVREF